MCLVINHPVFKQARFLFIYAINLDRDQQKETNVCGDKDEDISMWR